MPSKHDSKDDAPGDIAIIGDLDECEADVIDKLLELDDGADCTLFIDSGGGRVYSALAISSLIQLKELRARAVVLGACSSAALMVLAACKTRLAVPYSVFQFHPVRWESGENVERTEANEWAKHFAWLEEHCDELLARLLGTELSRVVEWSRQSRYLTGAEMAEAGIVQLIDPAAGASVLGHAASSRGRKPARPTK